MRMRTAVGGSLVAFSILAGTSLGGALTGDFAEVEPAVPDGFVTPADVNDAGQSTGYADFGGAGLSGFLRAADGTYTELVPLGGETFSQGEALNESGAVVGGSGGHAVLWEPGDPPLDLGALPGDTDSIAVDINDSGWIVGTSNAGGAYHGWARDPGGGPLLDMGTIGGSTILQVAALNNAGVAVGRAFVGGEFVPFRWTEADGMEAMPLPDGEVTWEPDDINASGQVVGHTFEFIAPDGFYRAYLYDGAAFTQLEIEGYTTNFPQAVNDEGLVVGFVDVVDSGSRTPAAWDTATGDATAFPLFLDTAFTNELVAVNNQGLALGVSREGDDFDRMWIGSINPDPVPAEPTAPAAQPADAAPDFTG